jgi:hypothetical protein
MNIPSLIDLMLLWFNSLEHDGKKYGEFWIDESNSHWPMIMCKTVRLPGYTVGWTSKIKPVWMCRYGHRHAPENPEFFVEVEKCLRGYVP